MTRSRTLLVVGLCVAILEILLIATGASPVTAGSDGVIDQEQPVIDTTVGGLAIGGGSQQQLAQVVTAGITGRLTAVRFPVACSTGSLTVEMQPRQWGAHWRAGDL